MRSTLALCSIALGLACAGCGSPTRESAAEEHVSRALDELARSRPVFAEGRLQTALRLDPSSARAGALLHLLRPRRDEALLLEFYDVQDVIGARVDADKLVEIVEGKLGEDEGGSVEYSAGVLIVRKSLEGHERVVRLIDALRRTADEAESRTIPVLNPVIGILRSGEVLTTVETTTR